MFKKTFTTAIICCLAMTLAGAQSMNPDTKWHWEEGTICIESPERPAGQENVIGLAVPKIECVRIGFVGLGSRGPLAVKRYSLIPGVQIVALCDHEEDRAVACQQTLRDAGLPPADIYSGPTGYQTLCERDDIDLVYIATDWNHHYPVAKYALEHGKHAAVEVPSAMNLEQCWGLVNLAEKNRLHCMILENCCYDSFEMMALNMVDKGVLGEIIRAEGAYLHFLNNEKQWRSWWNDPEANDKDLLGWQFLYNKLNRGDLYPTHGLGPVALAMGIHRGDRFKTLVAMDTDSFLGQKMAEQLTGRDGEPFADGDHSTVLMRTEKGHVVEIQRNTMTPQPYSRKYTLTGTNGQAMKYPKPVLCLNDSKVAVQDIKVQAGKISGHSYMPDDVYQAMFEKYEHPISKRYSEAGKELGHGGMDFVMDSRLVYCLHNGLPLDLDVYDLAEWCALAELSALSIHHNCAAVDFPDFTRGFWDVKEPYKFHYASPEDEAKSEAAAIAATEAQKQMCKDKKLWEKYDKKMAKKR